MEKNNIKEKKLDLKQLLSMSVVLKESKVDASKFYMIIYIPSSEKDF